MGDSIQERNARVRVDELEYRYPALLDEYLELKELLGELPGYPDDDDDDDDDELLDRLEDLAREVKSVVISDGLCIDPLTKLLSAILDEE